MGISINLPYWYMAVKLHTSYMGLYNTVGNLVVLCISMSGDNNKFILSLKPNG